MIVFVILVFWLHMWIREDPKQCTVVSIYFGNKQNSYGNETILSHKYHKCAISDYCINWLKMSK